MPVGPYTGAQVSIGNGVSTLFPYGWKIIDQTHLQVKVDGVVKVLGADYTVDGVGSSNGGNANFLVAPAVGAVVQRARVVPYQRDGDYQANGDFKEETVDDDFDLEEMQIQQLSADIARGFKAPLSVTADQVLSDAMWDARASMMLGFDAAGAFGVFAGLNPLNPVSAFIATLLDDADAATAAVTLAVIAKAIGTAKGDIIGFTGNAAPVRKAVGTDGSALVADSTQADGLRWDPVHKTQALVDGANVAWDTSLGAYATLTLGGNRTLSAPTNFKTGHKYVLLLTSGGFTPVWDATFVGVNGGGMPAPSASGMTAYVFESDGVKFYLTTMPLFATATNSLGADVALNNTANYFDGPSVNVGTVGVFLAIGQLTFNDAGGAAQFHAKLYDGTTVKNTGVATGASATTPQVITLAGVFSNPAGAIRIAGKDASSTAGLLRFNLSGLSKDCTITVVRIG